LIRALAIAVLWSSLALAQSGGSDVFSFLDRSVFAGSSALANTAYINPGPVGAFAVQNPLLLNDSTLFQLEMSGGSLGEGIQLLQGSYGFKIKGHPVIAAAQTIQYGEFTATDVWGNNLGIFYAGDIALSLGTPLAEWRNWRFGMTGKLVNGTGIEVSIGAIEGIKFPAKLNFIAPKGTEEGGAVQFKIKADVTLDDKYFIRAGYSANADIVLEKRDSVLSIKEALLKFDRKTEEPYVEVQTEEGKFEKRILKLGTSDGVNIEVLEGVTQEDKIKVWNKAKKSDAKEEND